MACLCVDLSIFAKNEITDTKLNFELITESPTWLVLLCLAAGALYAGILYRKDAAFSESGKWIVRAMALLRFLTVTFLAILLLSPLIRSVFSVTEKPVLVYIQDESSSIKAIKDSAAFSSSFPKDVADFRKKLENDFDLRIFSVGDVMREGVTNQFADKETDLSAAVEEIRSRFSGRNLGAVVLASDGLYNKGSNPLYSFPGLKVPVYTVGLGDTTIRKDLLISKVNHNKNAFLGNSFPVEITIDARQCASQSATLSISRNEKELFSKSIRIDRNRMNMVIPVVLEADQKGVNHYVVRISKLENEISYVNNTADFFVDVSDNRQLIQIVANAPHPDLAALKEILSDNPNFEVKIAFDGEFDGQLNGVNLLILHSLPGQGHPATKLLESASKLQVPMWFIMGSRTDVPGFNRFGTGTTISDNRGNLNEIQSIVSEDFSLFTLEQEEAERLESLPPLISPFGNYEITGSVQSLLLQKVGNVKTGMPMLYFSSKEDVKIGVLTGEGIWKWRLQEYSRYNESSAVKAIVTKTVQYLALRDKRTPFRLFYKNAFAENEQVMLDAELYNPSGEIINTPDARLNLIDENGKNYPFTFSKTEKSYTLNAGYLPVGHYKLTASVKLGTTLYTETGSFTILALQAEMSETIANHQLLAAISGKTGGRLVPPDSLPALAEEIKNRNDIRAVSYEQKRLDEVINLKWIFILLITLLSAEWFLRKRNGSY